MPRHILIVDDDRELCALKKAQLERDGEFTVTVVNDPRQALKAARRKRPDLILLDIMMPGKDGFEVLAELKSDIDTAAIPVIMHSGVEEEESRLRAAELYNEDYVLKSADRETLVASIRRVLARRR